MNYTDDQLQRALAKMLPEKIRFIAFTDDSDEYGFLYWKDKNQHPLQSEVRDTELLHLCHQVESALSWSEYSVFKIGLVGQLLRVESATWQQRVESLAKIKGIEI